MTDDLPRLRVEYPDSPFEPDDAGSDPMATFAAWFSVARAAAVVEPNAMSLATVGAAATPSVRMVLLKAYDPAAASFTWYTNLDSRKATEIREGEGRAALCWWWPGSPGRQVRAIGSVQTVDRDAAAAYFASRPRAAQRGAAASPQSRAIPDRGYLVERLAQSDGSAHLEIPDQWGGLRLVADELEFWQGASGRLHDRVVFLRTGPEGVVTSRAAVTAAGGAERLASAGQLVTDPHGATWLRARLAP